jgi:hypothetical protein
MKELVMNQSVTSRTKTRSPNYPTSSLAEAIARLKRIYDTQQRYPASRETLVKLMGYSSLNGASASAIAALSKYGLLEGHGDELRVSELGQDLVLHRPGDPEYAQAIERAAFAPHFFRELHDLFPTGLPSDHTIHATLVKRGFNKSAIPNAMRAYRETMELLEQERAEASLPEPPKPSSVASPHSMQVGMAVGLGTPDPITGQVTARTVAPLTIPLSPSANATLYIPMPMSATEWAQMMDVLEVFKRAVVEPQADGEQEVDDLPS